MDFVLNGVFCKSRMGEKISLIEVVWLVACIVFPASWRSGLLEVFFEKTELIC